MKNHSNTTTFSLCIIYAAFFTLPKQSFAGVWATIHPADTNDTVTVFQETGSSDIDKSIIVVSNEEYINSNAIKTDHASTTITGRSEYTLGSKRSVTRTENLISVIDGSSEEVLVAPLAAGISYSGTVNAPDSGGVMTVTVDVTGAFNYITGAPSLGLGGLTMICRYPSGNYLDGGCYNLSGEYANTDGLAMLPNASSVFSRDDFQVYDNATGETLLNPTSYTDIIRNVQFLSSAPDTLSLQISLTVPVQNGDFVTLDGGVYGGATHAFLEDFSKIDVGDTGEVDAASGHIDVNMGAMNITLSNNVTLTGDDAPPSTENNTTKKSVAALLPTVMMLLLK
nr:hypothetical protein [uncultured Desulfobulbus sp.]